MIDWDSKRRYYAKKGTGKVFFTSDNNLFEMIHYEQSNMHQNMASILPDALLMSNVFLKKGGGEPFSFHDFEENKKLLKPQIVFGIKTTKFKL